jgi:hypothetical protein
VKTSLPIDHDLQEQILLGKEQLGLYKRNRPKESA